MPDAEPRLVDMQALDRNKLAAERTLMAWVRTCLSMIGFGFLIYKFFQIIEEHSTVVALRPQAPRNLGLVLTGLGTSVVLVAAIQHWNYVRTLKTEQPYKLWNMNFIVAFLTAIMGAMMFGSILLRSGPFG
jgi:putative membrane protein